MHSGSGNTMRWGIMFAFSSVFPLENPESRVLVPTLALHLWGDFHLFSIKSPLALRQLAWVSSIWYTVSKLSITDRSMSYRCVMFFELPKIRSQRNSFDFAQGLKGPSLVFVNSRRKARGSTWKGPRNGQFRFPLWAAQESSPWFRRAFAKETVGSRFTLIPGRRVDRGYRIHSQE